MSRCLLVGHDPELNQLVLWLSRKVLHCHEFFTWRQDVAMKTGAVARIDVAAENWAGLAPGVRLLDQLLHSDQENSLIGVWRQDTERTRSNSPKKD